MARGGMAALYLARLRGPEQFEKLLVVKLIHEHLATEAEFIQMFLDEARITAMIHHPNVATVHEMGKENDVYYLAIEYIHGQNMRDLLRAAVRQPDTLHWSHACNMISGAAAGLHAAHELKGSDGKNLGIVHRDVSPQNILVSYDGHVKVVDFGIAYAAERLTSTRTGTVKGKAAYMSPEHVMSDPVDRRSDIFSLGTVLYEAVTMTRLFRADNEAATLLRVRDAVVPPPREINPDLPPELEKILLRSLAREPDDRYSNAGALAEALQEMLVKTGHYVGQQEVGRVMEKLFHDRRKIREEQIQRAQAEEDARYPQIALGMVTDPGASSTLAQVDEMHRKAFRPPLVSWIGGALVVLAVTSLLVYLVIRDRAARMPSKGEPPTTSAKASARPLPNEPPNEPPREPPSRAVIVPAMTMTPSEGPLFPTKYTPITIEINIRPRYAKPVVTFRGKKYRGSPFRIVVPKTATPEMIEIRAPGFFEENVVITPNQDLDVSLTMKPSGPQSPMRPHRRPMRPMGGVIDLVKDLPNL
ncbi:MAG: serine/threonine-protein kinase [bacterium]